MYFEDFISHASKGSNRKLFTKNAERIFKQKLKGKFSFIMLWKESAEAEFKSTPMTLINYLPSHSFGFLTKQSEDDNTDHTGVVHFD